MIKSIYVAATSQHVGKTTSTLGLVAALRQTGIKVGYCKPVGQEFLDLGNLRVDKDALLFSTVMDFPLSSEVHSPVILGKGATSDFLDEPEKFPYRERILHAAEVLVGQNDLVIFEGTGHPGVGSVVDLSNADVAKLLQAGVVLIVEGGIGNTIDRLSLCLSKFYEKEVPLIGVIINKVLPEKVEKVRHYVGGWLEKKGLKLLGILPYDKTLSHPIMASIMETVNGRILSNEESLDNRVEDYLSGSLVDNEKLVKNENLLLVVSYKRLVEAILRVKTISDMHGLEHPPISGIVVTGDGIHEKPAEGFDTVADYVDQHKIPVITTALDPLGSVIKISRIEVKINTRTPWKSARAIELIKEHVDLEEILKHFR